MASHGDLRRLTTFRHNGRAYEAVKTEERFYFTADSTSRMVDFFQEPSVRQVRNIYGLVKDDLQTMQDVNCFNVYVDAQVRLLDSIAVTRHFPDGELRVRTTRLHYTSTHISRTGSERRPREAIFLSACASDMSIIAV